MNEVKTVFGEEIVVIKTPSPEIQTSRSSPSISISPKIGRGELNNMASFEYFPSPMGEDRMLNAKRCQHSW